MSGLSHPFSLVWKMSPLKPFFLSLERGPELGLPKKVYVGSFFPKQSKNNYKDFNIWARVASECLATKRLYHWTIKTIDNELSCELSCTD